MSFRHALITGEHVLLSMHESPSHLLLLLIFPLLFLLPRLPLPRFLLSFLLSFLLFSSSFAFSFFTFSAFLHLLFT